MGHHRPLHDVVQLGYLRQAGEELWRKPLTTWESRIGSFALNWVGGKGIASARHGPFTLFQFNFVTSSSSSWKREVWLSYHLHFYIKLKERLRREEKGAKSHRTFQLRGVFK
jgi:hypothetical protein